MAKSRQGLDKRHRDKSGRIEKKHGNTKVAALRKEYGDSFAKGRRKDMMLKNLLKEAGCDRCTSTCGSITSRPQSARLPSFRQLSVPRELARG